MTREDAWKIAKQFQLPWCIHDEGPTPKLAPYVELADGETIPLKRIFGRAEIAAAWRSICYAAGMIRNLKDEKTCIIQNYEEGFRKQEGLARERQAAIQEWTEAEKAYRRGGSGDRYIASIRTLRKLGESDAP